MQTFMNRRTRDAKGPSGHRAYAVGDIHGRLDLLEQLIDRIERDIAARPERRNFLVFLGDLIDRGPNSAEVVERLRTYAPSNARTMFLLGNHEEVLLRLIRGDCGLLDNYLRFGGAECLRSYGLEPMALLGQPEELALRQIAEAIPPEHVQFLAGFGDTLRFGDYLFVHAGIRPGVELAAQNQADLRWIRYPFLDDNSDHGFVVVHGHTISPGVEERPNRIGIDTGAYQTGVLTALAIEEEQRWYLATVGESVRIPAGSVD